MINFFKREQLQTSKNMESVHDHDAALCTTAQCILESKTQKEQQEQYIVQTVLDGALEQDQEDGSSIFSMQKVDGVFKTIGQELGDDWMSQKQRSQLQTYRDLCHCSLADEGGGSEFQQQTEYSDSGLKRSGDGGKDVPEGSRPLGEERRRSHRPFHADPERMMMMMMTDVPEADQSSDTVASDYGQRDMMMRDLSEDSGSYTHDHENAEDHADVEVVEVLSQQSVENARILLEEHEKDVEAERQCERLQRELDQVRNGVTSNSQRDVVMRRRDILKKHIFVAKHRMKQAKVETKRWKVKRKIGVLMQEMKEARRELKERKALSVIHRQNSSDSRDLNSYIM